MILWHSLTKKADAFNSFFASAFVNEDISSLPGFQVDTSIPIFSNVSVTPDIVYLKLHSLNINNSWPQ